MSKINNANLIKWSIPIGATIFLIVFQQIAFIGHYGFDDLNYARIANGFNEGFVDFNDHFTYRWGLLLPLSFFYKLFGVNDFSSALPSLLSAVIIAFLVFFILRKQSAFIIGIAVSLTVFTLWNLSYSLKIMADMPLAACFVLLIFILAQFYYHNPKRHTWLYAVLIAVCFFYGFLIKETIILIIPLLGYLFIYDAIHKRNIKFWLATLFFTVLLFLAYFIVIKLLTGNYLGRFSAIMQNSYLNLCSYGEQPISIVLKRVGYEFVEMLIKQSMFAAPALALALILNTGAKQVFHFSTEKHFFILTAIVLLLSSNFMTISATSYNPMCLDPRHYLFLTPICAIVAAYFFIDALSNPKLILTGIAIMALATLIDYFLGNDISKQTYFFITIILSLWAFSNRVSKAKISPNIFILGTICVLLIYPNRELKYASNIDYPKQKQVVTNWLSTLPNNSTVITDEVQKRYCAYFMGFKNPKNIVLLNYTEADTMEQKNGQNFYIIKNQYTSMLCGIKPKLLPSFMKFTDSSYHEIYNELNENLIIFSIDNLYGRYQTHLIKQFTNTFDTLPLNWNQHAEFIQNDTDAYDGPYYNVPEYSATLQLGIDSLAGKTLQIVGYAMVNSFAKSDSKLVISLENNSNVLLWDGYNISEFIDAYGSWWPIKSELMVDKSVITPGTELKVYIWNPDKTKMYIDNFTVTINELK